MKVAKRKAVSKRPPKERQESFEDFVRRNYCVSGPDGRDDPVRLRRAKEAVQRARLAKHRRLPEVPGVPRLRYRIENAKQISEAARRFLPEIESDPRLHALSLVDPLLVANELGISVSPAVASTIRRAFTGILSFDLASLDENGRLQGVGEIHWIAREKA